jgi:hypothetical protein
MISIIYYKILTDYSEPTYQQEQLKYLDYIIVRYIDILYYLIKIVKCKNIKCNFYIK